MGPPSDEGGNTQMPRIFRSLKSLQWGRPPMRAETRIGAPADSVLRAASMGPPSDEGGNRDRDGRQGPRNRGFNGAALR